MQNTTQYYVFSADNQHVGPVSADLIARGVLAGKVPEDAFVAPVGSAAWSSASTIFEITEAIRLAKGTPSSMRPSANGMNTVLSPPPPPPPPLPRDLAMATTVHSAPPTTPANAMAVPAAPMATSAPPIAAPAAVIAAPKPAAAAAPAAEKKPVLDPRYKLLPLAVFGVFAGLGILETLVTLIVR